MIARRPQGPPRTQAARRAHRVRDRPRRRDDQRQPRPHRHRRQELRRHLRPSYKDSDAVVTSKVATSPDGGKKPSFTANVLQNVQHLPDVARAARLDRGRGTSRRPTGQADRPRPASRSASTARDQSLSPLQARRPAAGRPANGQIAIDRPTADDEHFAVGDTDRRLRRRPRQEVRGRRHRPLRHRRLDRRRVDRRLRPADRAAPVRQAGQARPIRLDAKSGVTPTASRPQIAPLLPETARVKTAHAQAASDSNDTQKGVGFFRDVPARIRRHRAVRRRMVIANTFSITVSQRIRELATLRTLGASRRQVLRSVVLEVGRHRPRRARSSGFSSGSGSQRGSS